jgi:MFS family permease
MLVWIHRAFAWLGSRRLLAFGTVVLGVGAIGLARARFPWELYVWAIVMAAGWSASTTTAIAMTLAPWFDRRRGLALSLALNGASAGGFTVTPLLALLVQQLGLSRAVTVGVLASLAVLVPLIFAGISSTAPLTPAEPARAMLGGQREALRSSHVWSIALPFALVLTAQVGFIVHQMAFLLPHLGIHGAANAVASTAVAALTGRVAMAPLIDRIDQRLASAASFTSQAVGLGLMLIMPDQPVALYIGSVLFGLSVGNVITLPALIVQREFSTSSFALVISTVSMVGYTMLAFGPTLLALARDIAGSYAAAILLCIVLQFAGALILLISRPRHSEI